jgi:hypothetical protein
MKEINLPARKSDRQCSSEMHLNEFPFAANHFTFKFDSQRFLFICSKNDVYLCYKSFGCFFLSMLFSFMYFLHQENLLSSFSEEDGTPKYEMCCK